VCAFGEQALGAQKPLIDAAVEAGVKRFVPSEFGSNTLEPNALRYLDHSKLHAEAVEHLKSKEGQGNGFSWTAIACGPFFDWFVPSIRFLPLLPCIPPLPFSLLPLLAGRGSRHNIPFTFYQGKND
jgi:hypothetical protein